MNKNYSYPTTIYESILTQMYVFLVLVTFFFFFSMKKMYKKILEKLFFNQKICTFGQKYFHILNSRITVVHVNVNIFSKVTVMQTESNQEVTKND